MATTVEQLIKQLNLQPHPEGGFFAETYRAKENISRTTLPNRFKGDRSFSTAIYFLLPEGSKSSLHRITADEVWHFYLGGPMTVVEIHPDGKILKTILGPDVVAGQKLQHVVPHGVWFGAHPNPGTEFALVGCTVAPGFDFADFEMGNRQALLKLYPQAEAEIIQLTLN